MGRKSTKPNLPPYMRARPKAGGVIWYYLDIKNDEGKRTEKPLGNDYIVALKRYAELNPLAAPQRGATFGEVITKYLAEELPKLATNTQRVHKSDIKHLRQAFNDAPLDQIQPHHIKQFLTERADMATTANRCKRLFSTMWNLARGWEGYTNLPNPCEGIKGHKLKQRTVYVTDDIFNLIKANGTETLRDAMDLAYLTGQRPGDVLSMTMRDIDTDKGHLMIRQNKTAKPLRIVIAGELANLLDRIRTRKAKSNKVVAAILINEHGNKLTKAVLRNHYEAARERAAKANPELADAIREAWMYDLRAKAADDSADARGEQAAADLLGHNSINTTKKHYLRKGKITGSVK